MGKENKFPRVDTMSRGSVDIVIGGDFDLDHLVKVLQAVRKA
jgi:transposase